MISSQMMQMIMKMLQQQQGRNLFGQNPLSQQFQHQNQNRWGMQGRPQGDQWNRFWPTQRPQSNYPAPQPQGEDQYARYGSLANYSPLRRLLELGGGVPQQEEPYDYSKIFETLRSRRG